MATIQIGEISLQLKRKAIKNLYIRVLPPDGQVHVSAPLQMHDSKIQMILIERLAWIKKQQLKLNQQVQHQPSDMVTDERHYLWGKAYRLEIIACVGRPKIQILADRIQLMIAPDTSTEKKLLVLDAFYRTQLKNHLEKMIAYWQEEMGVEASSFGIKRMKTRWGSCNTRSKKIWLNLALAQKPLECVEYVVVHELVHLLEPSHNARFKAFMDKFMPNWRQQRVRLNAISLAEAESF